MAVNGDNCNEVHRYNRRKASLEAELIGVEDKLEEKEAAQDICMLRIRTRPDRCACNWKACEAEGPETCGEILKAEVEQLVTEQTAIQTELDTLKPPDGHCAQLLQAVNDFIEAIKEIGEALVSINFFLIRYSSATLTFSSFFSLLFLFLFFFELFQLTFLTSIACLVIDAGLATLGGILDGMLMLAFPPLLSLLSNPMCIMKLPMKLKVDPKKMQKLADRTDRASQTTENLETGMDLSGMEGQEVEAVGEATSLTLAFLGATTPAGVVAFLWELFKLVADKAGIDELSTFAESEDVNLIMFLVMLLWDGVCAQFATAIMTIVTQLIFCNCGFCDDSCEISQFNFRNKDSSTVRELETDPVPKAKLTVMQNIVADRFIFHPDKDTCSVERETRTVEWSVESSELNDGRTTSYWWQEGLCDNPECDQSKSTTGIELNPSEFTRTYTGVYGNTEPGALPGHALSSLDGRQAWSAHQSGDSMTIDAEETVTLAGVVTQPRFCPGPGILESIAHSDKVRYI